MNRPSFADEASKRFDVFLATPITPLLDENRRFRKEAKNRLQVILETLRKQNVRKIFCAIEREMWGDELMPGVECTRLDLEALKASDLVVAFPHESFGVHVELGWAGALDKPVVLVTGTNTGFKSPLVEGLHTIVPSQTIEYLQKDNETFPDSHQWTSDLLPKVDIAIDLLAKRLMRNRQFAHLATQRMYWNSHDTRRNQTTQEIMPE